MTRQEIMTLMGVTGDDSYHRISHFLQAGYTRDEVERFNHWWGKLGHHGMLLTREEILQAYTNLFPERGEDGCLAAVGALWEDGYRGPLPARILNRTTRG